ncbi:MAG TPA: hypothetical protein VM186_08095, partial [Planctomycetota bacterium]|nr:hypothetical protein [Planctomycetota bacterium]
MILGSEANVKQFFPAFMMPCEATACAEALRTPAVNARSRDLAKPEVPSAEKRETPTKVLLRAHRVQPLPNVDKIKDIDDAIRGHVGFPV